MADNKIVSIIIPTRNAQNTITDLISSIAQQSYKPLEVVIIDGGSTDSTIDILEEIKRKNEEKEFEIKILKEEDNLVRSPANARNIGILHSSGDYIIFLDADMYIIDKDFVEKVRYALDDNSWVRVKAQPMFDTLIEKALVADSLTSGDYGHWFCGAKRELFKERLFDPNLGFAEDADFFNDYIKNVLGIKPKLVDKYVCMHFPHTLKQFIRRNIWYGRTILLYLRKRNILWSFRGLRRLIGPSALLVPPLLIIISLLLSNLILLILGLGWFIEQIYKVTVKKIFSYSKLPSTYRSLDTFLTSVALEQLVRPFAWGLGVADYFFRRITGQYTKKGRD